MKLFKNSNGQVYSGDRQGDDYQLTDDEVTAYLEEKTKTVNKAEIQTKINALESTQLRALRELMFDSTNETAKTKLQKIETEIIALRAKLEV